MTRPETPPEPPLHRAARLGDIDTMTSLVGAGADIDARADLEVDNGPHLRALTPLMVAARSIDGANVETLRWLLDNGADLKAESEGDDTAAWYAAGKGGRWAFHEWRLCSDHVERLRFLLDAGLDPHECNFVGRSLMTEACAAGDPARVALLLERGVPAQPAFDPEEADRQHKIDIDYWKEHLESEGTPAEAVESELALHRELFPPARALTAYQTPLFCAAESGSAACVSLLLDAGVAVDTRDDRNATALHYAGSAEVVRTLVAAGGDVNAVSDFGHDPLDDALMGNCSASCGQGRPDVAEALLEAGAELERRDQWGHTRLYSFSFRVEPEAVRFLLDHGAAVDADQGDGATPLHAVCWQGDGGMDRPVEDNERVIEMLIAAGVDPNARNDADSTAMYEATAGDWGSPTAIRTLLRHGVDPDPVDEGGYTPLMLAAGKAEIECIRLLLEAGADPTRRDSDGENAVDWARRHMQTWEEICRGDAAARTCAADADETEGEVCESPGIPGETDEESDARERKALEKAKEAVRILEAAVKRRSSP